VDVDEKTQVPPEDKRKTMRLDGLNKNQTGAASGGRLLDRLTVLVGIDDTDNLASPGTGWIAQSLIRQLASEPGSTDRISVIALRRFLISGVVVAGFGRERAAGLCGFSTCGCPVGPWLGGGQSQTAGRLRDQIRPNSHTGL
jgi:hypothetical protein